MSIWQAVILGIVQGLTEFLPVSSSGHLVLLQHFFGISEGNLFFTVMLHVGSLAAVLAVFYKDIWELIKHPFSEEGRGVIIATLVTGIMYIALGDIIDASFSGQWLWLGFLYTAALLWYVTARSGRDKGSGAVTPKGAAFIGFMQGIAMFPGISRSGSTIAGGLMTGAEKERISRFSFILSVPAILAGAAKEVTDITLTDVPLLAVLIGVICAAVSGYLAIRFMLEVIKKQKLSYFSVYLIIIALVSYFSF